MATAAAALVAAYPVEDLCTQQQQQQQQQPCCSSSSSSRAAAAATACNCSQQRTREPKHAVHQVAMQLVVLTAEVVHLCVHQHSTMSRVRLMQCKLKGRPRLTNSRSGRLSTCNSCRRRQVCVLVYTCVCACMCVRARVCRRVPCAALFPAVMTRCIGTSP